MGFQINSQLDAVLSCLTTSLRMFIGVLSDCCCPLHLGSCGIILQRIEICGADGRVMGIARL